MKIDEKIAVNFYRKGEESHILITQEKCRKCTVRYCVFLCPAHLYTWDEESQEMRVEYSGCLECGTCKVVCSEEALSWDFPSGDCGIQYRHG